MNIRDLQYFLAVADLSHFGKAAEQCCVSQPTLSGQIKKLEEQLGVVLFERNNRHVMLTETGADIARAARRIMNDVDTLNDIARTSRDPLSGRFRLGAFPTLASYLFPTLVPNIKSVLPDLRLILVEEKTDQLLTQLHSGQIDAAFLALPIDDDFLESQSLFDDEFLLAVPSNHDLASLECINLNTIKNSPIMLLEEGHCLRDQALEVCQLTGLAPEQDFKATSLETLRQMVKAGTGITLIPNIAIDPDDAAIRFIPFTPPAPKRCIGLVWRKTSARKIVVEHLLRLCDKT